MRHARVILILACLFFCLVSIRPQNSTAVEVHTIGECIKLLSEKLKTHSTLSDFSTYTSSEKFEIDRALAYIEWQENLYAGSSKVLGEVAGNYDSSVVSAAYAQDVSGEAAVAAGGSVETLVGGEALDVARAAGWLDPYATAGWLAVLGGTIVYEDITQGSNFVTNEYLDRGPETTTKYHEDTAAEKIAWVRTVESFTQRQAERGSTIAGETRSPSYWAYSYTDWLAKCSGHAHALEGNNQFCPLTEAVLPNGETVSKFRSTIYGGNCPNEQAPKIFEGDQYMLAFKTEGTWYFTNCAGIPHKPEFDEPEGLTTVVTPYYSYGNWQGCYEVGVEGGGHSLAGYPAGIADVLSLSAPSLECQPPFSPFKGSVQAISGFKAPEKMHVGFPRAKTKAEIEELEAKKQIIHTNTGTPTATATLPTVVKKVEEKLKKGNHCDFITLVDKWNGAFTGGCTESGAAAKPGEPTPSPGMQEVPSCFITELSGIACKKLLEEQGFTKVELDVVTWEHAVVTKPAEAVIFVNPAAGSTVETSAKLIVESNPDAAKMPVLVPAIKYGSETGTQYKERLEREGWTKVEIRTLSETATDPSIGPDQASYTIPAEGSETAPGRATTVIVEANPSDAPVPSEGGSIGPPSLPGFHIANFGVLCKGFPFGVPCWLIKTVESWSATSKCPVWSIGEYTVHGKKIPEASVNLCSYGMESIMEKARIAMLIFSTLGLVLLFYRFAKGGSPPSGSGVPDYSHLSEADDGVYL